MQRIAVDVGNTGTKYGIFEGNSLVKQGYFQGIDNMPGEILNHTFEDAIVASVAADAANYSARLSVSGNIVTLSAQTALPVLNNYKTPQTLGADRIAAAVGANYLFPGRNCLVFDAGTAITHEFITNDGTYMGGGIAPGLRMKLKALHTFTERLPLIDQIPDKFPLTGQSTQESILSGVLTGTVAELNGLIQLYSEKAPDLTVILCGGDAGFFESNLKGRIFVIPELVLIGLHRILTYNV
ncbi:type III pantothenate kinase [Pontibacter sp. BT310]|uniref:Type III pantothenate kinase n=1 Tax=Pontibacter populi TaxID=890055 RepID=A0ABS6X8W8_9BACT|nr:MULTISPECIES: type III pantothenate kinase [Pontibacter]MBJ6117587.1 type III pantothenate kinase [Pontibacter sp. BT310]MBR0570012.1 type III pantothenate kinase [Microvirga sp. STS03]MBW3364439.1 type III pantothenate kinase [Pontibacter populi]